MKKSLFKFFLVFTFVFLSDLLFSEVLLLRDGSLLKGKIIKMNEDSFTVLTNFGEMVIDRVTVQQMFSSEEDYQKFIKKESSSNLKNEDSNSDAMKILTEMKEKEERSAKINKEIIEVKYIYFWGFYSGFSTNIQFFKNGKMLSGKDELISAMEGASEAQAGYEKHWNGMVA